MTEEQMIQRDRMRFTKNSLSSTLTIIAILFDVLYFVKIYQSDVGNYYYNYLIGISVTYNLVFMLAAFLSSEGVKNYKKNYSYLLLLLGVGQIVRIFILPMRARGAVVSTGGAEVAVMGNGQFMWLVVCLVVSAACLIAAAAVNLSKCAALSEHMKSLEQQSV